MGGERLHSPCVTTAKPAAEIRQARAAWDEALERSRLGLAMRDEFDHARRDLAAAVARRDTPALDFSVCATASRTTPVESTTLAADFLDRVEQLPRMPAPTAETFCAARSRRCGFARAGIRRADGGFHGARLPTSGASGDVHERRQLGEIFRSGAGTAASRNRRVRGRRAPDPRPAAAFRADAGECASRLRAIAPISSVRLSAGDLDTEAAGRQFLHLLGDLAERTGDRRVDDRQP